LTTAAIVKLLAILEIAVISVQLIPVPVLYVITRVTSLINAPELKIEIFNFTNALDNANLN
jgi:hypothetical protein